MSTSSAKPTGTSMGMACTCAGWLRSAIGTRPPLTLSSCTRERGANPFSPRGGRAQRKPDEGAPRCLTTTSCAPLSPPPASQRSRGDRRVLSRCCAARLSPATPSHVGFTARRRGAVRLVAARRLVGFTLVAGIAMGLFGEKLAERDVRSHDAFAGARARPAVPSFSTLRPRRSDGAVFGTCSASTLRRC